MIFDLQAGARRLQKYPVFPELLLEDWKRMDGTRLTQALDLPEGAQYVRSYWDAGRDTLFMVVEHESFAPVHPGQVVPQGSITFRESRSLEGLRREVGSWASLTFPDASSETICAHLGEEVGELRAAAPEGQAEEAADILLLLLHFCFLYAIDLGAEATTKLERCRDRTWTPGRGGYLKHSQGGAP